MRPTGTQKQLERRRRLAVQLLNNDHRIRETARQVGASPSSVVRWRDAYKKEGLKALDSKSPPCRPCRLTERQLQELRSILLKGARSNGYKTELWTLKRIAQIIRRNFGVDYQLSSVWYILSRIGYSCQKPERRAKERNEQDIETWRKKRWPYIKKRTKERQNHCIS